MLARTVPPPADVVARLVDGAVVSRLAVADGRLQAARAARPVAGEIEALREELRVAVVTRVVVAAAGGAGVAAEALAAGEPRLVTSDWAPRGPRATGPGTVVCQLTGEPDDACVIDEASHDLNALQQDLARADADELARRGHPVLRLHLTDRLAGLVTVARAVQHL
ncbi:MAG: hypothetical protein L0I24_02680 [Pseudonocardia sp.]|nr:hypothetical protein [Pseudonocardia sp.]